MDIEEALRWVDINCYAEEAVQKRLRSRRVARTLADEIERLRAICAKAREMVFEGADDTDLAELLENAEHND